MADVEERKLTDFTPDARNANKGTERGAKLLDKSLRQYGAGRSILVDKHGRIIAGNKTQEAAVAIGLDDAVVVKTRGDRLVVVQREDLDLDTDKAARELAYADNRASEVSLAWDAEQLLADMAAGVDLDGLFTQVELDALLAEAADDARENIHKPSHGYDFRDIHAGKLAYRVEAAWRSEGGLALDLYSGQGQLAEWYARRFERVVRVDAESYDSIEYVMSTRVFLDGPFAEYALDFDFVDFDDEGSPLREIVRLFERIPAERTRPFVLCLTDGSGLNLKVRGRYDPGLYLLDGRKRQATGEDYLAFDELVSGAVERAAARGGWTAQPWSSARGSEGNVLYQTYLIRRASGAAAPVSGA